jgi:hypothetical protein
MVAWNLTVSETAETGSSIGSAIVDSSTGSGDAFMFDILASGNEAFQYDPDGTPISAVAGIFTVDKCNGMVYVGKGDILNFQYGIRVFHLVLRISLPLFPEIFTDYPLRIEVRPMLRAPIFLEASSQSTISRSVNENATAGTFIGSPVPATAGNSTVLYDIVAAGSAAALFGVQPLTGQLYCLTGTLDYETRGSYSIILRARNADNLALLTTIVVSIDVLDVNDLARSLYDTFEFWVSETNVRASASVGVLQGTDQDIGDTFTFRIVLNAQDDSRFLTVVNGSIVAFTTAPNFDNDVVQVLQGQSVRGILKCKALIKDVVSSWEDAASFSIVVYVTVDPIRAEVQFTQLVTGRLLDNILSTSGGEPMFISGIRFEYFTASNLSFQLEYFPPDRSRVYQSSICQVERGILGAALCFSMPGWGTVRF